jgi:hypothetical protein
VIREAAVALALSLVPAVAHAGEAPLVFVADPHLGMEGGVRTFDSIARVAFRYEQALPPVINLDERKPAEHAGAVLGRFAKLVFIDEPIAEIDATVIHEAYGHGARIREHGGGTATYSLRLPGIYCTLLSPSDDSCSSTTDGNPRPVDGDLGILVTLGGIEANALTSWWIDERMIAADGWMHHGDLLLYFSKLVYGTSFLSSDLQTAGKLKPANNDVDHYVTLLADRFNRVDDRASIARRLRTGYLWAFADPMLAFSAYGTFVHVLTGDRFLRFPLPRVGSTSFYPSPRFVPSPWGGESYLDLFLGRGGAVLDAYGRVVTSGLTHAAGGGLRAFGVRVHDRVALGAELDVWRQPEVLFDVHAAYDRAEVWGMNAGLSADVTIIGALGATARVAWKSRGWLTGAPVDEGVHGYVGASFAWDRIGSHP